MIINRDFSGKPFLFLQGIHILVFFTFIESVNPFILFASGLICIVLYGLLIRNEILRTAIVISPFIFYLASAMIRLGFSTCWAASAYHQGYIDAFNYGVYNAASYLMYGQAILLFGDWCFIAGYFFMRRKKRYNEHYENLPILPDARKLKRLAISLIIFGWMLHVASIAGIPLHRAGQLFTQIIYYASPAGILLLLYAFSQASGVAREKIRWLVLVLFLGEFVLSLRSYMKQSTMILLIPVVIYFVSSARQYLRSGRPILNKTKIVYAFGAIVFVMLILFPYSEIRRHYFWEGKEKTRVPEVTQFLLLATEAAIPGTSAFKKVHEFPHKGLWAFFSRQASLKGAGWSYNYVEEHGNINGELLKDVLIAIIPRIFWQGKPMISPGRKVAVWLGQAESFETATTASHVGGMAAAFYLNWGWACLVLGMFLNGILLCWVWKRFRPYLFSHPIATIVVVSLFVSTARHFESATEGNIPYYMYILVVFYPILLWTRHLFSMSANRPFHVRRQQKVVSDHRV